MTREEFLNRIIKDVLLSTEVVSTTNQYNISYRFNNHLYRNKVEYYRCVTTYLSELYGIDDWLVEHMILDRVERKLLLRNKTLLPNDK